MGRKRQPQKRRGAKHNTDSRTSLRNFLLVIEYDGADYNGWQIQSGSQRRKNGKVRTIQGAIKDALFKLFSKKVDIISCGRTDSGVHAGAHVANFKAETVLSPLRIQKALNSLLPDDIKMKTVKIVSNDFNAQYDALTKTYRYSICNREHISPFIRRYAYHFKPPLNIALMSKEAKSLLGKHDFAAFGSSGGGPKKINCVRTIKKLRVKGDKGQIHIDIEASGFLYNMARNIAGTLIEIGRGRFPEGSAKKILKTKDRKAAGPTAPAKGLCLVNVRYR